MNPVLREGNSDRRAPEGRQGIRQEEPAPHGCLGVVLQDPCRHDGRKRLPLQRKVRDRSAASAGTAKIEFVAKDGAATTLKADWPLEDGDVIDATYMSVQGAGRLPGKEIQDAKDQGILFSLHMKATMMKVSDPIIFGHCVKVFLKDRFSTSTLPPLPSSASIRISASATWKPRSPVCRPTRPPKFRPTSRLRSTTARPCTW